MYHMYAAEYQVKRQRQGVKGASILAPVLHHCTETWLGWLIGTSDSSGPYTEFINSFLMPSFLSDPLSSLNVELAIQ